MLFLLAFVLALHSSLARGESAPAGAGVCVRLLRAIDHVPRSSAADPVRNFFTTFDRVRVQASLGAFTEELAGYAGPHSLANPEPAAARAHAEQLDSAIRYRTLFARAARTREDFVLAKLHLAIDRVNHAIGEALDCGRRDAGACVALGRTDEFEDAVTALKVSWSALSPVHRAASLDWVGRELVEGLSAQRIYRLDLSTVDGVLTATPHRPRTFPHARRAFEAYLLRHAAEAPVEQLKYRYYRQVATRVIGFYGIGPRPTDDFARLVTTLVGDEALSDP